MQFTTVLSEQALLAKKVLESNTGYSFNKKIIHNSFFSKNQNLRLEDVKLRLIVIDSTYSTQMGRRLFGFSDLAREILKISENSDLILKDKLTNYLQDFTKNNEIDKILTMPFGLKKSGVKAGVATSLISKYFYFVSNFQFPIYDSLIKNSLPIINKKYKVLNNLHFGNRNSRSLYFETILAFNKKSGIYNIDRLDNLCWLFGKIVKGSFSLVIKKSEYLDLIDRVDTFKKDSKEIDKNIHCYLSANTPPKDLFSKELIEFIEFVYNTVYE